MRARDISAMPPDVLISHHSQRGYRAEADMARDRRAAAPAYRYSLRFGVRAMGETRILSAAAGRARDRP